MLTRSNSRRSQRRPLGRSKSTTCITPGPRALGDIVGVEAERDAYIAANLSYHRAYNRHSFATPSSSRLCYGLTRSKSATGQEGLLRSGSGLGRTVEAAPLGKSCGLKKQQSVRFTGPTAQPRRRLAARANQAMPPPSQTRRPGRTSTDQQPSWSDNESQPGVSMAARSLAYQMMMEAGDSLDSHVETKLTYFGRLRKSRSMFTSSTAPTSDLDSSDSVPERLKDWLAPARLRCEEKENMASVRHGCHGLRAPRSMGFLRGHLRTADSGPSSREDDDGLPRSFSSRMLRASASRRRLRSQPSFFFRNKHRRCETSLGLAKSLRESSNDSAAPSLAFSGSSLHVFKESGLRVTARKVSRSLKSRLRGLFGRSSKSVEDTSTAATLSLSLPDCSDSESCHEMDKDCEPIAASVCRVPSGVPSLHPVSPTQQLRSRKGSLDSLQMEHHQASDDKSRVTSWTNSSANTMASQGSNAVEWERQRLSVIKENSLHIPSHKAGASGLVGSSLPPGAVVDSQRVYSALLKRLNETKGQQGASPANTHGFVPPRGSSVDQAGSQEWQAPRPFCQANGGDDVFCDDKSGISQDMSPAASVIRGTSRSGSALSAPYRIYPRPTAGEGKEVLPGATDPKPDGSMALLASPSNHLFRAASPYRRAIREAMEEAHESEHVHALDTRYLSTLSALSLPTRRPSTAGSMREAGTGYAESVYSRASDDLNQNQADKKDDLCSTPSAAHGRGLDGHDCKLQAGHGRDASSASSVEWKTWLSANVSKLETPATSVGNESRPDAGYALPMFGHVREEAEIDSPGEVATCETPLRKQATKTACQHVAATPCSGRQEEEEEEAAAAAAAAAASVDENTPPAHLGKSKTPLRRGLRAMPSLPSVKQSRRGVAALPRMRSLNTLGYDTSPSTRDEQLLKRRVRRLGPVASATSSPGLSAAMERQFGKAGCATPVSCSPRRGVDAKADWEAQVMGSKRMVDLFLSSRRRGVAGSMAETESSDLSSAAFI
ncbi:hypothetical protein CDD81_6624 [Ophiocordyceps australis]|uniref:Uncharacterized protein n=1 Tax=Ophiocordyceps australis TaxID=1399860 RepID=A0A2C5Y799_9HYPO|nr:hypothetical protein CDD81_6624 [Ophiocordyceps australis]